MDHSLEAQAPHTLRTIRQEFVHYSKETFPHYGEGRTEKLSYATFKAKLLEHETLHQELFALYGSNPDLKGLSADLRTRMVALEVRMSQLEHELCLS
jgi:hypothetical protein